MFSVGQLNAVTVFIECAHWVCVKWTCASYRSNVFFFKARHSSLIAFNPRMSVTQLRWVPLTVHILFTIYWFHWIRFPFWYSVSRNYRHKMRKFISDLHMSTSRRELYVSIVNYVNRSKCLCELFTFCFKNIPLAWKRFVKYSWIEMKLIVSYSSNTKHLRCLQTNHNIHRMCTMIPRLEMNQ